METTDRKRKLLIYLSFSKAFSFKYLKCGANSEFCDQY